MSKELGYLGVSMSWDENIYGEYYVTADDIFKILPKGVRADVHIWDSSAIPDPIDLEKGSWVLEARNWECLDTE